MAPANDPVAVPTRSGRRAVFVLAAALVVGGVALGLWLGRPGTVEVEVMPPGICNHHSNPPGRPAALVNGVGPFEMLGVVYEDDLLISSEWEDQRSNVPVKSDSDHGWLRVSKGWFGSQAEYVFVADDGRITNLKPTTWFIVGCNSDPSNAGEY